MNQLTPPDRFVQNENQGTKLKSLTRFVNKIFCLQHAALESISHTNLHGF